MGTAREGKQAHEGERPRERTPLYTLARLVFGIWLRVLYPVRWHNREQLSLPAPFILIANHRCFIDPLAIAIPIRDREVRFLAKRELTQSRLARNVLTKLHAIPVTRHGTDMGAMRASLQALREGHILGIFPEGTRRQPVMMQEVESGAALIALRARVPVLPCYIHGKIGPFRVTHIYYGAPMSLEDLYAQGVNSDAVQALCGRMRDTLYAMRAQAEAAEKAK